MKKQIIMLGIVVIILAVGLSGCNEIDSPLPSVEEKFIGTWKASQYDFHTFFSDGTSSQSGFGGVWEIKDDKLVITQEHGTIIKTYDYYFSENNTKLHLKNVGGESYTVYTKQ